MNRDLAYLGRDLRFRPQPLVGDCLSSSAIDGARAATGDQLPGIVHPWSARQVWLFRTGLVTAILVYPDDDFRASCILMARPSGWYWLLPPR